MKKFRFDLQDVLEVRKFEEDAATAELAKALAVENEIQNKLNTIALQYTQTKNSMKGNLNGMEYISAHQYFKLLEYQKEELFKELAEANIVTEEKRKILAGVMQKVQALETLKEDELKAYKKALNQEEEDQADEINTIRFNNK